MRYIAQAIEKKPDDKGDRLFATALQAQKARFACIRVQINLDTQNKHCDLLVIYFACSVRVLRYQTSILSRKEGRPLEKWWIFR
jgi:hypothetical protein